MLYSKNGSIPKTETDGLDGWIEVPEPPTAGEGEEVVWWFPPGWVVRPVKPVKEGFEQNWSQTEQRWVESPIEPVDTPIVLPEEVISIDLGGDTLSGG